MEAVELDHELGNTNHYLMRFFQIMSILFGLLLIYNNLKDSKLLEALGLLLSTIAAVFLIPLWWRLGNWLRYFLMPSLVVTRNASETFSKKIFWLYGPQSIIAFWLSLLVLYTPLMVLEHKNKTQINSVDESMTSKGGIVNSVEDSSPAAAPESVRAEPQKNSTETNGAPQEQSPQPPQVQQTQPESVAPRNAKQGSTID